MFGCKATIPSELKAPATFKYTYDDYIDNLLIKFQKSHEIAKQNLIKSKNINKNYYDKKANKVKFKVGDKVLLINQQTKINKSKKLTPNYIGPYEILEVNSPVNYTILKNRKKFKVHADRLKHFNCVLG